MISDKPDDKKKKFFESCTEGEEEENYNFKQRKQQKDIVYKPPVRKSLCQRIFQTVWDQMEFSSGSPALDEDDMQNFEEDDSSIEEYRNKREQKAQRKSERFN